MKHRTLFILLSAIWLSAVAVGTYYLMRYAYTPGVAASPPTHWPVESALVRNQKIPTFVLFGHPNCPCTAASVGELNQIMAKTHEPLQVYVAFVVPKDADASWKETSLWSDAQLIPGVRTILDENGIEAKRFNAHTSGQVILYDADGKLVFSGGITSARGHFGDNLGKSVIISFVNNKTLDVSTTPVFGCALFNHDGNI